MRRTAVWVSATLGVLVGGCSGEIDGRSLSEDPRPGPNGNGGAGSGGTGGRTPSGTGGGSVTTPTTPVAPASCDAPAPGPSPMRRLTHREYDETVRVLLGETANAASSF